MNKVIPIQDQQLSVYDLVKIQNKVKLQPFHKPINKQTQDIICKICLQGYISPDQGNKSQNQLIVPCQCSGSVGYVHQKCIKLWVQRQMQNNNTKRAYCQICKQQIFFKMNKIKTCSCKIQKSCKSSLCNIVCIIVQMILLAIVSIFYHYINHITQVQIVRYLTVSLIIILSITFILTFYLILKQNFLKSTKIIEKIYSIRQCQQIGLRQVKYPEIVINAEELLRKIAQMKKKRKKQTAKTIQNVQTRRFTSIQPVHIIYLQAL